MSAVVVPSDVLLGYLTSLGFRERKHSSSEIVYERAHEADSRYRVVVFTSIRRGEKIARGVGKDAIRVCGIFERENGTARGVCKLPRVHRTGTVEGVLSRMRQRMREAYAACSKDRPKTPGRQVAVVAKVCSHCGCTTYGHELRCCQAAIDATQEKHHPGSRPIDLEPTLLDGYDNDPVDEP